jgi:hypothetical protein
MKIIVDNSESASSNVNLSLVCPHCGHKGTFVNIRNTDVITYDTKLQNEYSYLGIRRCPNEKCKGHLFFILDRYKEIVFISPSETIPFDKENIPINVLSAFEEAVKCHSNDCFISSAIMIRKTLEEISVERKSKGKNLYEKLKDLGNKILIPRELIDAMDELRLLGNDAAHIEAQTFNEIGKNEIEISIEFTKEILKAVYQYESLLGKLKSLKKNNEESTKI